MPRASAAPKPPARRGKAAADALPAFIRLKQKQSGKARNFSTGFAWDLFLFAGFFGLPLFLRRLPHWGAVILALWCVDLLIGQLPIAPATARLAEGALFAAFLAVQLWLGFKGNRLTVRAFLAHGWSVDQGGGDLGTRRVIERWKLAN